MNLKAEQIFSKQFPYMNWLTQIEHPLKISIGFLLKYFVKFVTGFAVINIQIPMNPRNSPKSILGTLILPLVSTIMTSSTKVLVRNRTNAVR